MTNRDFIRLYESDNLENVSIWRCKVNNRLGELLGYNEMICAMYQGKYYIRISKLKGLNRLYHDELRDAFVKEFEDKNSANNYFMKVKSDGYERV